MTTHEALRLALEALEYAADMTKPDNLSGCECPICAAIPKIKEALAAPQGSCIACGNRMTGDTESFVVATAGAPAMAEDYSPQRVEAPHQQVGDKLSPSLAAPQGEPVVNQQLTTEPVAFYDFQEKGFYWSSKTSIGKVPVSVKVEPMPLYAHPAPAPLTYSDGVNACLAILNKMHEAAKDRHNYYGHAAYLFWEQVAHPEWFKQKNEIFNSIYK